MNFLLLNFDKSNMGNKSGSRWVIKNYNKTTKIIASRHPNNTLINFIESTTLTNSVQRITDFV